MKRFFLAFLLLLVAGCAPIPPSIVTKPEVIEVCTEHNPDVIWIVRAVGMMDVDDGLPVARYGLFACYRQPASNPGAPVCYLARMAWDPKDLMWPGLLYIEDGKVVGR